MGQYLKVDRVDSGVVRRCVLFRVIGAIRVVVNVRQRATRPELIPQVNVQVFAAGLRWAGAGTLHGQRSLQYPGPRGAGAHRAARRVDLSRSIVRTVTNLVASPHQQQLTPSIRVSTFRSIRGIFFPRKFSKISNLGRGRILLCGAD